MLGNVNITAGAVSGSRTRSSSKTAAYWQARALDEALGGFLSNTKMLFVNGKAYPSLFNVYVERYWSLQGVTRDAATEGAFNLSRREMDRSRSYEKSGTVKPPAAFPDMVRSEAARIRDLIEKGVEAVIASNPPLLWTTRFWNEVDRRTGEYATDVPSPTSFGPSAEDKGKDTAAAVDYHEPTVEEAEALLGLLGENVMSEEDAKAWTYSGLPSA
jgi:hypothetical protein